MDIERLEREHGLRARNYAASLLHNWEDAEDIVLDAERVIGERYPCHHQRYGRALLMRTVGRMCFRKASRDGAKARRHPIEVLHEDLIAGESSDPQACLLRDERRQAIAAAVSNLPEKQSRAVVLRYYAGWEVAMIARLCKVSRQSVYSRLRRAMESLRKDLQEVTE